MLSVEHLSKTYRVGAFGGSKLQAVRDVSFDVKPGEVLSLIGESGSGKSTIGRMILRLLAPTDGRISVDDIDVATLHRKDMREYYRRVQGVFQDPFSSYNPVFKIDRVFGMIRTEFFPDMDRRAWDAKLSTAIESVSLTPRQVLGKFPHQLSGGQLQRLLVARALLLDIRYLVADEIISMLDASTRIDVLNLLGELKETGLGIVFITHDLSLGNYISDTTLILRYGCVVEMGATAKVFGDPRHPYTQSLLASVPQLHSKWAKSDEAPASNGHVSREAAAPALVAVADDHLVAAH